MDHKSDEMKPSVRTGADKVYNTENCWAGKNQNGRKEESGVGDSPEISDQAALLRQMQEVDEEVHARLRLLLRQAVDSAEESQRVADGELVV